MNNQTNNICRNYFLDFFLFLFLIFFVAYNWQVFIWVHLHWTILFWTNGRWFYTTNFYYCSYNSLYYCSYYLSLLLFVSENCPHLGAAVSILGDEPGDLGSIPSGVTVWHFDSLIFLTIITNKTPRKRLYSPVGVTFLKKVIKVQSNDR